MAEEERVPPRSAEELLSRYAAGDRNFKGADVLRVDLRNADLRGSNLSGADLTGADFCGANLTGANLRSANLTGAFLQEADLGGANLSEADLRRANLISANFRKADLRRADLWKANVRGAYLIEADLRGALLSEADLTSAYLSGANFGGANLGLTVMLNVDLSALCEANLSLTHSASSSVDFRTIVKSLRAPNLKYFLQRTGMPEVFIEFMIDCAKTLDPLGVFKMLQSTFISYGGPDEVFARMLNDALHRNGVTTFFFPVHAIGGQKLRRTMSNGVNDHDRVILVCSRASLKRPGVLNEIEEVLQREARDGGREYLIPIRLDDYVFKAWKPKEADTARAVKDRVILDFEGADTDPAKFNAGLLRLIAALK